MRNIISRLFQKQQTHNTNQDNSHTQEIHILKSALNEQNSYRRQNIVDFFKVFNALNDTSIEINGKTLNRLSRIAGTTLLEAAYIIKSLREVEGIGGDWCEYGVAHGRTSALLATIMLEAQKERQLWLYDSFEGLPNPHSKDLLINDIYQRGSMEAYAGDLSFPEDHVLAELDSVKPGRDYFHIVKGWITAESLLENSPQKIAFAYLDMDFYQSTYDVLKLLVDRMPSGGIAIVDDYGFFSEGVRTAVSEVMAEHPNAFSLEQPYNDKFAVLKRISA